MKKNRRHKIKSIISAFILGIFTFTLCMSSITRTNVLADEVTTKIAAPDYVTNSSSEGLWAKGSQKDSDIDAIKWRYKSSEGQYYLYLPSTADTNNLVIWHNFKSDVTVNGNKLISGEATSIFNGGGSFTLNIGNKSYKLVVMQSENISSMFLTSESGNLDKVHANKEYKESGEYFLVSPDGNTSTGTLESIKGRGNSSWEASQKIYGKYAYNIKLDKKADLLGMGKSKKWSLLANNVDQSLLRNKFIYDLAQEVGMPYTPQCESIDLYANGEYLGTYLLSERVEVDSNRVDITDLEGATEDVNSGNLDSFSRGGAVSSVNAGTYKYYNIPNNPSDITGGYLLEFELDERYPDEVSGFVSNRRQQVVVKSPEFASKNQVEYIKEYFQNMEDAVYSSNGYNSKGKYYTDYLDITSAARAYIIQELTMNLDGGATSFFLYKDAGDDKLHCGPVWDFDWTLGGYTKKNNIDLTNANLWWIRNKNIYNGSELNLLAALCKQSDFMAEVARVWAEEFYPALEVVNGNSNESTNVIRSFDSYYNEIKTSASMNFKRWNVLGDVSWGSANTGSTHSENISYLKNFTSNRTKFLNNYFSKISKKTKVYFNNSTANWSEVYAYVWTEGSVSAKVIPMTLVDEENKIYEVEVSGEYEDILFKNTDGTSSWKLQTINLKVPTGSSNCYKPNGTGTKPSGNWNEYTPKPKELTLTNINSNKVSPQQIGNTINFTAIAETIEGEATYEFKVNNKVVESTGNVLVWTPEETGTYTITATVTDSTGSTSSKSINYVIKEVTKNKTFIYYKGYSNAYIHYKIGNGTWTIPPGILMESTSELSGYTHKIEIDLGDSETLTACFNNGNGSWDSNGGKNYTFGVGTYTYSSGKITEIQPINIEVNSFNSGLSSPQLLNTEISLSASTSNSNGNVTYKFIEELNNEQNVIYEGSNNTCTWTPKTSGEYKLTVIASDENSVDSKSIKYKIADPLVINKFTSEKGNVIPTDTTTKLTVDAAKGLENYIYKFYLEDGTILKEGNDNTLNFTESKEGNYKLYVEVSDSKSEPKTEVLTIEVYKKASLDISLENKESLRLGSTLNFNLSSNGGYGNLSYSANINSTEIYNGNETNFSYYANESGTFTLSVNAIDENGFITTKTIDFTISPNLEIQSLELDNNKITLGDEVTITANTVGIVDDVIYKFTLENGTVLQEGSSNVLKYTPEEEGHIIINCLVKEVNGELNHSKSTVINVKEKSKNLTTIYYKGYTTPYIHYKIGDGIWTNTPGIPMIATSEKLGYTHKIVIDLGESSSLTACFNDGNGTWDNNGGKNYTFINGDYTFSNGVSTDITERDDDVENLTTIYYKGYSTPYIHYKVDGSSWTTPPGMVMEKSTTMPGYFEYTINLGSATNVTVCFNNGSGSWDSNNGKNYTFSIGKYTYENKTINQIY